MQFFICALSTLLIHTASALLVDIFPGQVVRCALSAVLAAALEPLVGAVGRGRYFAMSSPFVSAGGLVSVHVSRWKGMGVATGDGRGVRRVKADNNAR